MDDGCLGGGEITLRIDRGGMDGGKPIDYSKKMYFKEEDGHDYPNFYDDYYSKDSYFSKNRHDIFHYCVFCYYCYAKDKDGDWGTNRDGRGSYGGDYFVICDANMGEFLVASSKIDQAQTFMHELGHNLKLAKTKSYHCKNDCAMEASGSYAVKFCPNCWSNINLIDCLK